MVWSHFKPQSLNTVSAAAAAPTGGGPHLSTVGRGGKATIDGEEAAAQEDLHTHTQKHTRGIVHQPPQPESQLNQMKYD